MNLSLLFNQILPEIDLPIKSDEEFIRVEKKLMLQTKLDASISKNDIEEIVGMLKNYSEELNYLRNEKNLVNFLNQKTFEKNEITNLFEGEETDKINRFIELNFEHAFKDSISFYFKKNQFKEPLILSNYNGLFSLDFQNYIDELIFEKLEFGIEMLQTDLDEQIIEKRLSYLNSTDFFKLLDEYPSHNLEEYLAVLTNLAVNQLNQNDFIHRKSFYYNFLIELNQYEAMSEDLNKIIKQNHKFANENKSFSFSKWFKYIFYALWILSLIYRCS